jgi:hypothetical protein
MKYSPEELNKVLEEAPRNDKGQPVISDEDFMDNLNQLPRATRSESGLYAKDNGYIKPLEKGTQRTKEIASKAGKVAQAANAERRKMAETIDLFLKSVDETTGMTMQEKIIAAMGSKAMDGCVGAAEFLRDTVGEKPTDQVSLDVMTDKDREVLKNLTERLGLNDKS